MTDRNATVQVRVTDERKEQWNDAADERGMSLSDFLRLAVTNEINGRSGDGSTGGGEVTVDTSAVADELVAVRDRLDRIESEVNYTNEQLATATDDVPSEARASFGVAELIEVLPQKPKLSPDHPNVGVDRTKADKEGLRPPEVADRLDAPVESVRKSLANVASKSGRVVSVTVHDKDDVVYFKNV